MWQCGVFVSRAIRGKVCPPKQPLRFRFGQIGSESECRPAFPVLNLPFGMDQEKLIGDCSGNLLLHGQQPLREHETFRDRLRHLRILSCEGEQSATMRSRNYLRLFPSRYKAPAGAWMLFPTVTKVNAGSSLRPLGIQGDFFVES